MLQLIKPIYLPPAQQKMPSLEINPYFFTPRKIDPSKTRTNKNGIQRSIHYPIYNLQKTKGGKRKTYKQRKQTRKNRKH